MSIIEVIPQEAESPHIISIPKLSGADNLTYAKPS